MDFIQANIGNIAVGAIVFAALAGIIIRLVSNFRRGGTGCGCGGCSSCKSSNSIIGKRRSKQ